MGIGGPTLASNAPDQGEVRRYLEKILASRAFARAPRVQEFLRFVVEETLAGRAREINEPLVAAHVFNLGAGFDRRKNSIVRAEATHVRRRLHNYYLGAGGSDPVIIDLPRGGYIPFIRAVVHGESKPEARWRQLAAWLSLVRPGKSAPWT
ncbi:MAG: hypothetical protein LAP87_05220 [Acidobacteriia bacterium]|nr:hypothetical protein [Terriglobia bacterium]